jgi:hypothetical protein
MTTTAPWTLPDLDQYLSQQEWQVADQITLDLLLDSTQRTAEGYLDITAIAKLPCDLLHQIDQRWMAYSEGHFGFTVQRQRYLTDAQGNAFEFSRQVDWTLSKVRLLGFYKLYEFLNFSLTAPQGHLPARWFWQLSWRESWRIGGFGTGRGAAFGDANMLDALMVRLERCERV